jgi:hypothetical protein
LLTPFLHVSSVSQIEMNEIAGYPSTSRAPQPAVVPIESHPQLQPQGTSGEESEESGEE